MDQPEVAPAFAFEATNDIHGKLSDYLGRTVVLFFYPKDNTPGCTQEAKEFSELQPLYRQKNAVVFGISKDALSKHESFKKKHNLSIELISDPEGTLCESYGVMKKKSMFGKSFLGIERSTFVIGPKGHLVHTWRKVKVKGHAQEVLDSIDVN
jgi:thioredoxin-dependent peroxiredoxin